MTEMAALHDPNSDGFYGWVCKRREADNRYSVVVTPTHIVFGSGLKHQLHKIQAAIAARDSKSLTSTHGVTVYSRQDLTGLRYVPHEERVYVYQGEKSKWHPMWPEIFSAISSVMPGSTVDEEEFSSMSANLDRYFLGVMPLILLALHWMAHNWDTDGVRRGRALLELIESVPATIFYPLMGAASLGLFVLAYFRNQTPLRSFMLRAPSREPVSSPN